MQHKEGNDILLGDAFYATYFLLCELVRRGVDGRFEQCGAGKQGVVGLPAGRSDSATTEF